MKIKETLVAKVRKGEGAIEHTGFHIDLPLLRKLLEHIFTSDCEPIDGTYKYYFVWIKKDYWDAKQTLPAGMEAIPLKDFFEDEKDEEKLIGSLSVNQVIAAYKKQDEEEEDIYDAVRAYREDHPPKQEVVDKVVPTAEDIKRWFQLLVGKGEGAMIQDMKTTFFNQPKQ